MNSVNNELEKESVSKDSFDESSRRPLPKILNYAAAAAAVILGVYQVVAAGFWSLPGIQHRALHLGLGMALVFIFFPLAYRVRKSKALLALDGVFSITMLVIAVYVGASFSTYEQRVGLPPSLADMVLGVSLMVFILETARRTTGWPFPIVTLAFIAYAMLGAYLPEPFTHRGLSLEQMVSAFFLNLNGIFGVLTGVSANYIILFIIFAAFVTRSGVGAFIKDLSMALLGSLRGGPAKMAVCASSAMGMLTGSSIANAAGVGSFTIPLMTKTGYSKEFAAGVEASSGMGAQIMPPILGGSAFIMVEVLGVPYTTIALAALPIAIMYYVGLFISVDYGAVKLNIPGLPRNQLPQVWTTFKSGWYQLIPIAVLIIMLGVMGATPARAGFWAIVSVPVISLFSPKYRMSFRSIVEAIGEGVKNALIIIGVIGAASLVAGIIGVTGLGLQLSNILIELSGGNVLTLLVLCAVSSIIMGMGLPVLICYTLLATLVAPALVEMGIQPLAAHMFIFYYGILSAITPPVAPDCFVTAGIAKCSIYKAALVACKIALPIFLIPFFIVYNPLLLHASFSIEFIWRFMVGILGVYALASGIQGVMLPSSRLNILIRILLVAIGFLLLKPDPVSDLVGLVVLALIQVLTVLRAKKMAKQETQVEPELSAT